MYPIVPYQAPRRVKGKSSRPKRKVPSNGPAPTSLIYKGPSRIPSSAQQDDVFVTQINNTGTLTASAAGLLNTVFDSYSQASTPSDWTSLINLYTEFRILSMDLELIPWNTYNTPTTSNLTPLYSVVDRSNNTPLASAAGTVQYDSVRAVAPSKPHRRVVKMHSSEEAQWVAVGSSPATASRMYIKLYSAGNATSINMYDFVTRIIVQFRGRQ